MISVGHPPTLCGPRTGSHQRQVVVLASAFAGVWGTFERMRLAEGPVLEVLAFVLAAVAVIVVVQVLADKTGLPAAALLTVSGLIYAVLPGPDVRLDPGVILTFVIPPLIYSAALNSSLLAIRKNLRVVSSACPSGSCWPPPWSSAWALTCLFPGVGLAAGTALSAAVAPPDPVAALAVGGRAGLPSRLITIIEGGELSRRRS